MEEIQEITYIRPEQINRYPKQRAIIDSPSKGTITEGSTKSGKTSSHLVWLYEEMLRLGRAGRSFYWVSPTYGQAEIGFRRTMQYIGDPYLYNPNSSKLELTMGFNKAIIRFRTGENPDALYGDDVYGAVMDEYTRQRVEAFYAIMSTLTATSGRIKLIGNVVGIANWGYQLARKAEAGQLPDWKYFKLTAADAVAAGVMKQADLDAARRTYPEGVFLELFYGIPNQAAAARFFYAFKDAKHVGKCKVNYLYPIYLSFDFNVNPICCVVLQDYDETVFVPHVIKLENSNIYELCRHIKTLFNPPNDSPMYIVTGDATGQNRSALVKDNLNYYKIIKAELAISSNQIQVPSVNPTMEQNQVLCNAVLEHHKVMIDPDNAAPLIFDMKFAQMGPNKKMIKADRTDETQQLDAADGFRYFLNRFKKHFLKLPGFQHKEDTSIENPDL